MRPRPSRVTRPAAITTAALACLVMLGPGFGRAAEPPTVVSARRTLAILPPDGFYAAGGPEAAGPAGEILAQVELRAPEGVRTWAVIYRSTGYEGSPVGVSGLIIAPAAPIAAGAPPRTVLSIAHATNGLADDCAPSRGPTDGLVTTAMPLIRQGFVLAVTDYEGLGTPGPHPYMVGASEGHSVLDAALAAAAMPETGAGPQVVLIGGSQGGQAVLWAADMAATAAPTLDVVGAAAFAPAGDLEAIARFDRSAMAGPSAWTSIITLVAAWHDIYGLPLDVLTPEAQALVPRLAADCRVHIDRVSTVVNITSVPAWQARLRENTPAATATNVPVLIFQGDADELVPVESTRSMVARMCAIGDVVDLRVLPGADHLGSVSASSLLATVTWVLARLAGEPAVSTCPSP